MLQRHMMGMRSVIVKTTVNMLGYGILVLGAFVWMERILGASDGVSGYETGGGYSLGGKTVEKVAELWWK
jgi:hypothetical protein